MTDPRKDRYVREVLALYRAAPGTRGRSRTADRRLAEQLYHAGTPTDTVRAAILLTVARRLHRPHDAEPLPTINSLHYFLPVLRDIQQQPLDPAYLLYLELKVAQATALAPTLNLHQKA